MREPALLMMLAASDSFEESSPSRVSGDVRNGFSARTCPAHDAALTAREAVLLKIPETYGTDSVREPALLMMLPWRQVGRSREAALFKISETYGTDLVREADLLMMLRWR